MAEDESSVRVAVRIRPQIPRELIEMCRVCTSVTPGEPQITLSADRSFTYDYVFDTHAEQCEVYDMCVQQLVEGALEGYNATVLAYGQTGSGKTYTMGTGFEVESQSQQLGILPRAIEHLYSGIRKRVQNARQNGEPSPEFKVDAQFMELYNDDIIDLLDERFSPREKVLKIHEDTDGGISVKGITQRTVASSEETLNLLRQGALSRTTGATQMNSQSSRSHAIFTLHIKQQRLVKIEDGDSEDSGKSEFATLTAKFHFVDLAGSERLKRTQATGERAREGISINAGLFALGNVISALGDKMKKASHVPYRDSKLTRLLQDSLGGNSQTVMIACISPSDSDFMETLNTLNYANRARNIKNKVTVNQDKSSRTIALLREQIQDLQVELLEYKQGKRLVSSDGVEVVNDMCHENLLLQTEANNLRTRVKALQETVDALAKKNSELLVQRDAGAWLAGGEGKDVEEFIADYLLQIEELRARLLESEATCQQLRKAVSRQPGLALSPTNTSPLSPVCRRRIITSHDKSQPCLLTTRTDQNMSFSDTSNLIAEARCDVTKDLDQLAKFERREKNGNEHESDNSDDGKDDDDSDSESSDTDDKQSQYGLEIAELTNEISIKQKLIDELERSQQRMYSMKQHYEDKLMQLQDRIRSTQEERDKVLASFSTQQNQPTDKVKKVRDEYERKLGQMLREVKRLDSARKEHARLLKEQTQRSSQLKSLQGEVDEMKRMKVSLIRKMKEESTKHKQTEMKHTREIAALRKESRQRENQIRSLQAENRVKEAVLRRRAEEVSALRSRTPAGLSTKAAGRVHKPGVSKSFSPKAAKAHWSKLENNITKVKITKKAVALVERDMERLINERESLGKELEQLIKKKDHLLRSPYSNSNEVRDIQEQIESAQATMNYIQESISDCQRNIIQMEGTKDAGESFELDGLMSQVTTLQEGKYLIEKLYNSIVAQSLAHVQKELSEETLKARVQQLTCDNDTQNQLLQHLISSHHIGAENDSLRPSEQTFPINSRSGSSSSASTRSNSPTHTTHTSISKGLTEKKSNSSSESIPKTRRKTALPKDLLFPSQSRNQDDENQMTTNKIMSHSVNIPVSLRLTSVKPTELPQNRKTNVEAVSPRLPRKAVNLSSSKLDMDASDSPPGSPTTYRRFNSREENVFSRLTGGTQGTEQQPDRGTIQNYTGKVSPKAPLVCAYVASGHSRAVLSVAATDDLLFTGSKDRSVKVWDLQSCVELQTLGGHPNNVDVVKYCPVSRLLFSVSSAYVKVWDLRENPTQCVKTLCSSGLSMHGPILPTTPARTLTVPPGEAQLNDIALNNSGQMLYTAAGDRVRVWDLRKFSSTGKLVGGHQAAVMCLAVAKMSETEDCVVTGSKDHYIKVFDVSGIAGGVFSPKMTLDPPHYDGIQTLALQGDILFSGSRDMCIKKWDLSRQELVQSINNAHANWICGLELLPGGERLVSGCRSGILKVWSADSCNLLGEVKAHSSTINSVAVNSTHLFTASKEGCMLQHRGGEGVAAVKCPFTNVDVNWENVGTFPLDTLDNSVAIWKPQIGRMLSEKSSPLKERTSPSLTASIGRSARSAWVS